MLYLPIALPMLVFVLFFLFVARETFMTFPAFSRFSRFSRFSGSPSLTSLVAIACISMWTACSDPCFDLATRICQCESTQNARDLCRSRIQSQRNAAAAVQDAEACSVALDTCTCDALDQNRTELCGFTREPNASDDVSDGSSNETANETVNETSSDAGVAP